MTAPEARAGRSRAGAARAALARLAGDEPLRRRLAAAARSAAVERWSVDAMVERYLALYRRLGYREIGPFGAYEDNGSSIFMEKPL